MQSEEEGSDERGAKDNCPMKRNDSGVKKDFDLQPCGLIEENDETELKQRESSEQRGQKQL